MSSPDQPTSTNLPERQRRPSFNKFLPGAYGMPSSQLKRIRNTAYASSLPDLTSSPSSSSERSTLSSDNTAWSESSSDDGSPLTPETEIQDETIASELPAHVEVDVSRTDRKGVSTKLLTQDASVLEDAVGSGETGTQLIQKYCCGGGCCLLNLPPPSSTSSFTPIATPDNDAFKNLNLKLGNLEQDSELTNITPLPPSIMTLESIPKSSNIQHTSTADTHPPHFVKPHPPFYVYSAPLYCARELTKPGAEKRTFHFDLDVTDYPDEGGDIDFKVGGAIGVTPPNNPKAVDDIFDLLGIPRFLRDKPINLKTIGGRWPTIWGDEKERELLTTRRELLTWCSDIQSYAPTKNLLRLLAEHASAPNEKKILMFLSSGQGQGAFCELRTGPHLSLLQLLHAFPSSKPPLPELLSVLSQLMPRFYSLSNDPHVSSEREGLAGRRLIELAVTVHETREWTDEIRKGAGSGFLERIAKQFIHTAATESFEAAQALDLRVPMFRGLMANPLSKEFGASDGPMMLIGAGVGMAPFRGFILNRLRKATCANKIWLVQGIRDSSVDELYSGELGKFESQIKKVVQSRGPAHKTLASKLKSGSGGSGSGNGNPVLRASSETDLTTFGHDAPAHAKDQWQKSVDMEKESKYVQDEVKQQADIVWDIIKSPDGRVFVCGSSKGMGEGVEDALKHVAVSKGMTMDGAAQFWQEMKDAGKYIAETW